MTNTEKLAIINIALAANNRPLLSDYRKARHENLLNEVLALNAAKVAEQEAQIDAEAAAEEQVLVDCGQDDGMAGASAVEEVAPIAEKLPAYKVLANKSGKKSSLDNPVKFIHDWLNENPEVKRKQAVTTLVGLGVNYSTARTQYQRWFSGRK